MPTQNIVSHIPVRFIDQHHRFELTENTKNYNLSKKMVPDESNNLQKV